MSIEEQIAALEARIQQAIILASGCTEQAELAATRAEQAAARAELAALGSTQAEIVAVQAAESAQVAEIVAVEAATIAVIEEEQIEEVVEEIEEDASQVLPEPGRSGEAREPEESADLLDGERQEPNSSEPIVLRIEAHTPANPTVFKPNRTTFNRGRARGK